MLERENQYPFKAPLVGCDFGDPKYMKMLGDDPNIIIRVSREPIDPNQTEEFNYKRFVNNKKQLDSLSQDFGVRIPPFMCLFGPNGQSYIITERVKGANLTEVNYSEEEKEVATFELNTLYTGIAGYLDYHSQQETTWMISDLTGAGHYVPGNTQYVWGRSSDLELHAYLVDLGPVTNECKKTNPWIFTKYYTELFQMILQSQEKTAGNFDISKMRLLAAVQSLMENPHLEENGIKNLQYLLTELKK